MLEIGEAEIAYLSMLKEQHFHLFKILWDHDVTLVIKLKVAWSKFIHLYYIVNYTVTVFI